MAKRYETEFKEDIVRKHVSEGRSIVSSAREYEISKASVSNWVKEYREECENNPAAKSDYDLMEENRRLRRELAEAKKEADFLKKATAFFAREVK